ncbi:kelch domain-containing protein 7A [Sceloporus undulatus]|uniref:kelch domain-containing protein 7A n=1 Tax=Sceloporus undulatus TaxID=8520 RepID=UPI001C4BB8D2|nr:kelch domain-containing protein 7A [Sceloporus undulatus]
MTHGLEASGDQPSEMQLAGRLALSAAAFLLLTLAYRYYKSRGRPCGKDDGRADPDRQETQLKEELVFGGTGEGRLTPGLRQRHVNRAKEAMVNGSSGNLLADPSGPETAGESRLQGAPAERRDKQEVEKVEQKREEISLLGIGEQPNPKGQASEEEEEKGTLGDCFSYGNGAGVMERTLATQPRSKPNFSEGGIYSLKETKWDADSEEAGCCFTSQKDEPMQGEGHPTSENGYTLGTGKEELLGEESMSRYLTQTQEASKRQEGIRSFYATSDMDLAIKQTHMQSHSAYAFSSIATVWMEENFIKERKSKEGSDGQPEFSLRGKVYDYFVQSSSQSTMNEKLSYSSLDTQPIHLSKESEKLSYQEPGQACSDNEEDSMALQKAEGISSAASGDSPKSIQPEGQEKDAMTEENTDQKHPGERYRLTRKESFHKIIENPELQVPMEGFGSPTLGSSGKDTPPLVALRSSSASSLVGSMQSLQSDTSEEPTVELVAGAKFFNIPMSPESSVNVHLDLGNCYEVLCLAKKQKLEALREAAYKVMSDNYLRVLRTHAIYSRLNATERDLILKRRMKGRKYVTVADVNSQEYGHHPSRLCYYDDQEDTWHPLSHMPLETVSKGCAMCSMFNYLFVVAGCEGRGRHQRPSNRVFCYNPLTNIWREICPLNQARPHCKLVALDGYLYAIGGECLYTVERYDPRIDRWNFVAPLPNDTFAVAHTATTCDGEIYVTGGTLRYTLLKYIARVDTWKVSLTGGRKDRTTEMVTANGFIYRFDLNRSMGISVYRCGTKAKLWYECATHPMPFPACFQCAVVENLVYCVSRQFHIRFLADYVSPRFGTKELQTFPSPQGTLLPVTLVLPDRATAQTRV